MLAIDDRDDTGPGAREMMLASIVGFLGVMATVVLVGVALLAVVVAVLYLRRRDPDPRAGWPTFAATPIWFEDPASGTRWIAGVPSASVECSSTLIVPGESIHDDWPVEPVAA